MVICAAYDSSVREAIRQVEQDDANDAEAICESVTRPSMRFVPQRSYSGKTCITGINLNNTYGNFTVLPPLRLTHFAGRATSRVGRWNARSLRQIQLVEALRYAGSFQME
jgi:hypothetical protein